MRLSFGIVFLVEEGLVVLSFGCYPSLYCHVANQLFIQYNIMQFFVNRCNHYSVSPICFFAALYSRQSHTHSCRRRLFDSRCLTRSERERVRATCLPRSSGNMVLSTYRNI